MQAAARKRVPKPGCKPRILNMGRLRSGILSELRISLRAMQRVSVSSVKWRGDLRPVAVRIGTGVVTLATIICVFSFQGVVLCLLLHA